MPSPSDPARRLFTGPCDFVTGVAALEQLPVPGRPELAFAGRSNVGKSSLINALTGRKTLVRTSRTPGRTQQLNFFDLGGRLYLVDMPGYGYAKVSKAQKKKWDALVRGYLRGRPSLRCVFILIDARHGLKDSDREIMTMLDESAVSYRAVMTKTDKTKSKQRESLEKTITVELKKRGAAMHGIIWTSATEGAGMEDLRSAIYGYTVS